MATRKANLVGHLSPEKGNMWRQIYETSHSVIQKYWKHAHHYAVSIRILIKSITRGISSLKNFHLWTLVPRAGLHQRTLIRGSTTTPVM